MQLWELPHISIAPEFIYGGWLTNTLLCTWIAMVLLFFFFYFGTRRRSLIPSGLQNFLEWIVEMLLGLTESIVGKEKSRIFFPIIGSFFFFILFCNMLDILPGIETIGTINAELKEDPLLGFLLLNKEDTGKLIFWFRPSTTDLNLNLAMAITSVVIVQFFGFKYLGVGGQLSKFFNFRAVVQKGPMGLVDLLVGLLEIISEVGRIISFAFRLFGNIFAGSILLAVFAFLVPVFANVIFIPFEIFIGTIQAFVFAFLTLLFLHLGTISHGHHDEHEHVHEEEVGHETVREH